MPTRRTMRDHGYYQTLFTPSYGSRNTMKYTTVHNMRIPTQPSLVVLLCLRVPLAGMCCILMSCIVLYFAVLCCAVSCLIHIETVALCWFLGCVALVALLHTVVLCCVMLHWWTVWLPVIPSKITSICAFETDQTMTMEEVGNGNGNGNHTTQHDTTRHIF